MNTFIRVAEIWVPDSDGYLLEFGGGLYDQAPEFGALSTKMCFGRGEGLPGRVWEEGRPLIIHDLQGGFFQRSAAAKAAQLACAVAFPVFFGERLKAVVVLFCGSTAGQSGAIEVWWNDPATGPDLSLLDGVYGAKDAAFEAASRQTTLPRGVGLPGLAWQRTASAFVDGLSESAQFARAGAASSTELRRGLAIPCPVPTNETFVLTFLSAPTTPIASRIESWVAGTGSQSLQRAYGFDEVAGTLPAQEVTPSDVDPTIFATFAAGVPKLRTSAPGSGLGPVIAFPIVREGAVVETVAMYF